MPRLEPVTIATFPDKSNKFIVASDQRLRRPIMPHCAIFRNRIIVGILFRPVARCPGLDLPAASQFFLLLNSAVKTVLIGCDMLYAG